MVKVLNTVSNIGKKSFNTVAKAYEFGTLSIQGYIIQAILVLFFVIYSGIIVNYCTLPFLQFFENIIVKIVVLVIIAFIGLYSPAVALFVAIALIVTLQMAQKKKLLNDLEVLKETPEPEKKVPEQEVKKETFEGLSNQDEREVYSEPLGYNNNASCIGSCGGNDGNPETSSQCGVVKTWDNQISAQGLEWPSGLTDSVGYPVNNNY